MPSRNSRKAYLPNTYYHVYNRGVNKKDVFLNAADFELFLSLLGRYLSEPKRMARYKYPNFQGKIEIVAYCLMPNHFHLLIKTTKRGEDLADFMQCLITSYTIHINRRYGRSGHLFQGRYKAVIQHNQAQFLHITRYIHKNPEKFGDIEKYDYSSYRHYLNPSSQTPDWLMSHNILEIFIRGAKDPVKPYKQFVAEYMWDILQKYERPGLEMCDFLLIYVSLIYLLWCSVELYNKLYN